MKKLKKEVKAFQKEGEVLQLELMEHEKRERERNTSWISSFWEDMYLEGRWSVFLQSNPGNYYILGLVLTYNRIHVRFVYPLIL